MCHTIFVQCITKLETFIFFDAVQKRRNRSLNKIQVEGISEDGFRLSFVGSHAGTMYDRSAAHPRIPIQAKAEIRFPLK